MKKKDKSFWDQAKKNYEEVQTWPLWKRRIVISAETASTGQFIDRSVK